MIKKSRQDLVKFDHPGPVMLVLPWILLLAGAAVTHTCTYGTLVNRLIMGDLIRKLNLTHVNPDNLKPQNAVLGSQSQTAVCYPMTIFIVRT